MLPDEVNCYDYTACVICIMMEHWWNYANKEKPVTAALCPPQIPHQLAWYRTQGSAVKSRKLTA
jgi:hypothetical protein